MLKEKPRLAPAKARTLEEQSTPVPLRPDLAREVLAFMGYEPDPRTGKLVWRDRFYS